MVQQCEICIIGVLSYIENDIKAGTGLKATHTGIEHRSRPLNVKGSIQGWGSGDAILVRSSGTLPITHTLPALENRGGQWTKAPTLDSISQAQTSLQSRPKKLCKDHLMGDPSVLKIS